MCLDDCAAVRGVTSYPLYVCELGFVRRRSVQCVCARVRVSQTAKQHAKPRTVGILSLAMMALCLIFVRYSAEKLSAHNYAMAKHMFQNLTVTMPKQKRNVGADRQPLILLLVILIQL